MDSPVMPSSAIGEDTEGAQLEVHQDPLWPLVGGEALDPLDQGQQICGRLRHATATCNGGCR